MAPLPFTLPIAVQVAIGIFFMKEIVEAARRWRANARKMEAIKRLVSGECERNKFAMASLRDQIRDATAGDRDDDQVATDHEATGEIRLLIVEKGAALDDLHSTKSSSIIRRPHRAIIDKYLFEVASLDSGMFYAMERMSVALTEIEHVRTSFIQFIEKDRVHFGGFDEYAYSEISGAEALNAALYFRCTLSPLKRGRVR